MNISEHISITAASVQSTGSGSDERVSQEFAASEINFYSKLAKSVATLFRPSPQSKSILRNQTNLPAFLVIALGLSLLCNFTLRQNSAEASRPIGSIVSIEQVLNLIRQNPDDYELHSQLGELYYQQRNYKRAMFHLAEASRLVERFGD